MKLFATISKKIRSAMCAHNLHIGDNWVRLPDHQSSLYRRVEFNANCTGCGVKMRDWTQ